METTLKKAQIPEIEETAEDKKLSNRNLKHKYVIFARNRFIRNPPVVVINKDTNWPIALSRRVISEWAYQIKDKGTYFVNSTA